LLAKFGLDILHSSEDTDLIKKNLGW